MTFIRPLSLKLRSDRSFDVALNNGRMQSRLLANQKRLVCYQTQAGLARHGFCQSSFEYGASGTWKRLRTGCDASASTSTRTNRPSQWAGRRSFTVAYGTIESPSPAVHQDGRADVSTIESLDSRNVGDNHVAEQTPIAKVLSQAPPNVRPCRSGKQQRMNKPSEGHEENEEMSLRRTRKPTSPFSPPRLLGQWTDLHTEAERDWWLEKLKRTPWLSTRSSRSLAGTFLHHLIEQYETGISVTSASVLDPRVIKRLTRHGFTVDDVNSWSKIVCAPTDVAAAQLYLASPGRKPTFLLLEILRRPQLPPDIVRALLRDAWGHALWGTSWDTAANHDSLPTGSSIGDTETPLPPILSESSTEVVIDGQPLEETTFTVLASRLLSHSRATVPSALVSVAHMVVLYCKRLAGEAVNGTELGADMHARLSKLINKFIVKLSMPANLGPMKEMPYNWQAQRLLLDLADSFQPPLHLDRNTYRAVARVLLASKKSVKEATYSGLLQRSWPPWRRELHGVDAQRSLDQDLSRVVQAVHRMQEAGYPIEPIDEAISILGGRERDGTPTIHKRSLVKIPTSTTSDTATVYAARVQATRDVYEAWAAFRAYDAFKLPPSLKMYEAMFEKLIHDRKAQHVGYDKMIVPGDGLEVMHVMDDNLTESGKNSLRPPSLRQLYARMRRDGIRPQGRCLTLLLSKAPSLNDAIIYLRDSGVLPEDSKGMGILSYRGGMDPRILKQLPEPIFVALIRFLTRYRSHQAPMAPENSLSHRGRKPISTTTPYLPSTPLLHAVSLLRARPSPSKGAWYALFAALAAQHTRILPSSSASTTCSSSTTISTSSSDTTSPSPSSENTLSASLETKTTEIKNHIMSWYVLEAALTDAQRSGVQLDPQGFQFICIGLHKALVASSFPNAPQDIVLPKERALGTVKGIWEGLTPELRIKRGKSPSSSFSDEYGVGDGGREEGAGAGGLSKMTHRWQGSHIHAYIRVLALCGDIEGLGEVLQWMVDHQGELKHRATFLANGDRLLRRCLVTVRALFGDEIEGVREMVEQLDGWGGWPTDEEVREYRSYKDKASVGKEEDDIAGDQRVEM